MFFRKCSIFVDIYCLSLLLCDWVKLLSLSIIMSSLWQRKWACGHIMANFDKHSRCARCRDKGQGEDPCVKQPQCEFCELLTPEQVVQLATPTYKLRKEKQKSKDVLIDPASVTVISHVEQDVADRPASHNSSVDLSLPALSFQNYRTWMTSGQWGWPDWKL